VFSIIYNKMPPIGKAHWKTKLHKQIKQQQLLLAVKIYTVVYQKVPLSFFK